MISPRHISPNHSMPGRADQAGFASIVIAIVLVLVMSLLTIGFAELMRQEQRSALDRHLSSQAYYAAETGINDAAKALSLGYGAAKTSCSTTNSGSSIGVVTSEPGASYLLNTGVGVSADGVNYTCLLLNPAPPTLEYSSIDTDQSKVAKISGVLPTDPTATPVAINELDISWQNAAGGNNTHSCALNALSPAGSWNATGILRVGLTPLVGTMTRQTLNDTTFAGFLCPNNGGTTPAVYGTAIGLNKGVVVSSSCATAATATKPLYCVAKITGLSATTYGLDLRSIYNKTRVTIVAKNTAGTQLNIKGGQTMVDSTGKAQDVLRRIQVRIPNNNDYVHSDFSLESGQSICKQLQLTPASGTRVACP